MNKTFFFTLFKEGIGYESGLFRTVIDLYKNPQKVVEASINNDLTYVNPVKFMMTICGYFVLFNGFIIDWEKVSLEHFSTINYYLTGSLKPGEVEVFQSKVMAFLFSTGYIPLAIAILILQLYFISKRIKNFSYSLDYHKSVIFYYHGFNNVLYFLFTLSAALLPTELFLMIFLILPVFAALGYRKLRELKPIGAYFSSEQNELTKTYKSAIRKSAFFVMAISIVVGFMAEIFLLNII
jgi:hypothetical protein